jgi:hypothetical protein
MSVEDAVMGLILLSWVVVFGHKSFGAEIYRIPGPGSRRDCGRRMPLMKFPETFPGGWIQGSGGLGAMVARSRIDFLNCAGCLDQDKEFDPSMDAIVA